MNTYVRYFTEMGSRDLMRVGGKGAQLGELSRIPGIRVPDGFCVTTDAYQALTGNHQEFNRLLDVLVQVKTEDRQQISAISAQIRSTIESITIPAGIISAIVHAVAQWGAQEAYAIRSSATAEDLPTASFAGQQDSFLNVIGEEAILHHIRKCWASLFTDRAVSYRMQNGFDHREVWLAVAVQHMIFPQASGIAFTADPVTGNRKVLSIDAGFGLGEALVSGLVNADHYKLREGQVLEKQVPAKKLAIYALKNGGTHTQEIAAEQQQQQVLTTAQMLQLEQICRKIAGHYGQPQDIEWCLADGIFYIVQSRPITTLYPIPETPDDEDHIYISVGHQQMMTDPIKPLGLSFYLFTTPALMRVAGGRLFVDITAKLATRAGREALIDVLGPSDPLIKDALTILIARGDIIKPLPDETAVQLPDKKDTDKPLPDFKVQIEYDPAIVPALIRNNQASVAALQDHIRTKSGAAVFDFILEDVRELKRVLFDPQSFAVFMTAMNAASWINAHMKDWLGETNAADALTQSVPGNITSAMGLALLDVADVIRPYPAIIAHLQQDRNADFPDGLLPFEGGQEVNDAIHTFLDTYGMRCAGEIDITTTRWREQPSLLIPLLLSNIKNMEPGASRRKWEQGLQQAQQKEQDLLDRLRLLPEGAEKARETKRMIDLLRNYSGYREYPKYGNVSRYFMYKQALMKEAEQLVQANIIAAKEDVHYLSFEEFHEAVLTRNLDQRIIAQRKADYRFYAKLQPPRVITSDGEIITGAYKRENIPAGALPGLAVSSGVVEGRARVLSGMEDADLEAGDILVTAFTDPSWTSLFVSIAGLVTEVGGLMTHGSVIAREYGLPAVVGVERATTRIKDGQRIRVHGTDGYVQLL